MEDKYAQMRMDLANHTMKQLREIARAEGICLGYDGARKETAVAAIVAWRRHAEETTGDVPMTQRPEVCMQCPEYGDLDCSGAHDYCYMDVLRGGK